MKPSFKITICDDSRLAQRQLSLAIKDWDAQVTFADNGADAITAIKNNQANLLFLDLNMPIMNGYQVLEQIRKEDLPTLVIVVSGDIQKKALKKVTDLGAIAFITKPISLNKLNAIVDDFGLSSQINIKPSTDKNSHDTVKKSNICPSQEERFQETANIAMGKTAERLSVLLDVFINLSVPKVNLITHSELYMVIKDSDDKDFTATISQGFVASGISGESILMVDKSGLPYISKILGFPSEINAELEKDILVYLAGLLSSSFIETYFQQIGIQHINQGIPSFIDFKGQLDHLLDERALQQMLSIEVTYKIPEYDIRCDLLLAFTLDSIEPMNQRSELFSWTL
ncbi:MAG: response regulator [Oceanospirillaceae bacterium]